MPGGPAGTAARLSRNGTRALARRVAPSGTTDVVNGRHSNAPSAAPPESRAPRGRENPAPSVAHQIQADTPHQLVCDGEFAGGRDDPPRPADRRSEIWSARPIRAGAPAHALARSIRNRAKALPDRNGVPAVVRARGGPHPSRDGPRKLHPRTHHAFPSPGNGRGEHLGAPRFLFVSF